MSRHALTPLETNVEAVEVVIGWDPPLQTFFLTVRRPDPVAVADGDRVLLWLGDDWRLEPEPEAVLMAAALWASVPADLRDQLLADRAAGGRRSKPSIISALQKFSH